jgi:hypothetical protein
MLRNNHNLNALGNAACIGRLKNAFFGGGLKPEMVY